MEFIILQGVMNWFDKIKVYHKYRYDSYTEALKVFNEIKDYQASYDLRKKECLVTILSNDTEVLEYHKSYKAR